MSDIDPNMSGTDSKPPENPPVPHNVPPPTQGAPNTPNGQTPLSTQEIQSKKIASGLLAILLGGFGVHKFYLGYQQEGIIMLLVTVLGGGVGTFVSCGLLFPAFFVMPIIATIEGILYLTKSDEEFANTYLIGRKPWF